ncbi:MAG: hypothetical protein LC623_01240 [Halobacteriales archaeon]|nr:hypothetical protein [Halobacteriales archaeon]
MAWLRISQLWLALLEGPPLVCDEIKWAHGWWDTMAILTPPQAPDQPAVIHCKDQKEWRLVQEILRGRQPYLIASPLEWLPDSAQPAAPPVAQPAKPRQASEKPAKRASRKPVKRSGPPMLDLDQTVRHIEQQRNLEHSHNSAIKDQIPEGIPSRLPGTRSVNPDYNSAHNVILSARKKILARIGGDFVPVPNRSGWVMHQR